MTDPGPSISVTLLLFSDKADSPAMIKHAMDILKEVTSFLHPGQISTSYGNSIFAIHSTYLASNIRTRSFSLLCLEDCIWRWGCGILIGDYLACSGIATSGTADIFLKSSHLTKTRHAHQITCVVLHISFSTKQSNFLGIE